MVTILKCTSERVSSHLVATALSVIIFSVLPIGNASGQSPKNTLAVSPFEIQLQSRRFTPKAGIPTDFATRVANVIDQMLIKTEPGKGRAHIFVQLEDPPEPSDLERLTKQGITLLSPLNKRTWYASVTAAGTEIIGRTQGIRWADMIKPEDKLAKGVLKDAKPLNYQLRPDSRIAYSVLFHKDVTAEEVLALSKRMDLNLEDFDAKAFPVLRTATVNLPRDMLMELAKVDIIGWIEPAAPPNEDHNLLNAQPLSNVDDIQRAPYNLDGTGVTVGLWEAGDVVQPALLDLTPRLIVQAGQTADSDDHAAHVAGTIGASGVNVVNAEGMAPNVTIASWDDTNDAAEMVNAVTSLGQPGQPTPIQISSHSYGPGIGWNGAGTAFTNNQNLFGNYNNQAQGFDNIVFQNGLIVAKSAGNDRDDAPAAPVPGQPADCFQGGLGVAADCIGPRGTAKNVITIGAMNGGAAITGFSSYGPTDDGRIKPDLMAQGANMLSLACNCFDDRNGDGIDDVPNTLTSSRTMSGTSMSTPVVSGVAALVLQEAARLGIRITPAAMKALLIQTAQDVRGTGQSNPGPDYATGWGIVDAQAAIDLLRESGLSHGTLNGIGPANAWTTTFFVPPNQPEVHVTLVWDDPAGTPGGQILINDLDLRLIDPNGNVFTPWILNPAMPGQAAVENGGNDAVNNVEQVSAFNITPGTPTPGIWTVQVSASAGNLPQAPQAFAVAGAKQVPQIQIPGNVDFGDTCIGKTIRRSLNICNTGTNDLLLDSITSSDPQFSVTAPSSGYPVVIGHNFCFPFEVEFTPAGTGVQNGNITVQSNDPVNPSTQVNFTGNGIACAAFIQVSGSVRLGESCVNSLGIGTLNVCNTGINELIVDPITSSDPQFSVTTPSSGYPVVISHDFCFPFEVTFLPSGEGQQAGQLTIPSNDPIHPNTAVDVMGIGVSPDIRVTGSTDFGVTSAWAPAEKSVSVCNAGNCGLSVTSAGIDCPDFTLQNDPFPVNLENGTCLDLLVEFTPKLPGKKTCQLKIDSNDPDSPVVNRTLTAKTPLTLSLHAGLVDPISALSKIADNGSTINLDINYPATPNLAWDLRAGLSRFDGRSGNPDTELWTLGANAKYTLNPSQLLRLFVNGGVHLYHFDPGDFEAGLNGGIGLSIPLGHRFGLEATYNYHLAFTASPDLKFHQYQLGLIMSF